MALKILSCVRINTRLFSSQPVFTKDEIDKIFSPEFISSAKQTHKKWIKKEKEEYKELVNKAGPIHHFPVQLQDKLARSIEKAPEEFDYQEIIKKFDSTEDKLYYSQKQLGIEIAKCKKSKYALLQLYQDKQFNFEK